MRFRICIVALVLVMTTDVDAIPTIASVESPSVALGGVPARSNESVSFRQLQSHYSTPAKNGRRDTYTLSGHNYICRVIGDTLCDADIGDAFTVGEVMAAWGDGEVHVATAPLSRGHMGAPCVELWPWNERLQNGSAADS